MLYSRPQAFKCQPALQRCSYNLCWFTTSPLQPCLSLKLSSEAGLSHWCLFSPFCALLSIPVPRSRSPGRISHWKPQPSQVTTAKRGSETETAEGQGCQSESMTSWKPAGIPVPQPSGFETFTVINGIQFEKKFKCKEFFMLWILIGYGPYTFNQLITFTSN